MNKLMFLIAVLAFNGSVAKANGLCIVLCFDRPGIGVEIPGVVNATVSREGDDVVLTGKAIGTGVSVGHDDNEGAFANATVLGGGVLAKNGRLSGTVRGPGRWHEADQGDEPDGK